MTDKYYEGIKSVAKRHSSALLSSTPLSGELKRILELALSQAVEVRDNETLLLAYLDSMPESKEMDDLVLQIEASLKRSQKTQKETAKLRKRNQAMLAKL